VGVLAVKTEKEQDLRKKTTNRPLHAHQEAGEEIVGLNCKFILECYCKFYDIKTTEE